MNFGLKPAVGLILGLFASAAFANSTTPKELPPAYQNVAACRLIADSTERLACYDKAVATLDAAITSNDVYLVDKTQVRESRKTLFGLPLPKLGIFGGASETEAADANEVEELESTIKAVGGNVEGWIISIAEGSTWRQMDGATLGLAPKVGMNVKIKRGALGSFRMNIGKQPSIKVKRIISAERG